MTATLMHIKTKNPNSRPTGSDTAGSGSVVTMEQSDSSRNAAERAEETKLLNELKLNQDSVIFDQLFRRFAPRLKSYLMSLGSAADTAESVVQDVMVTVWTKAHLFNADKASARTWIFTLVRNRYIDLKRADARQSKAYDLYSESGVETEASDDVQFNHVAGQQISIILEQLPKEQAEILLMAYVEGKSHREIAEQLGVPIGTTKSRVRLAFQRLRKLMEKPQ